MIPYAGRGTDDSPDSCLASTPHALWRSTLQISAGSTGSLESSHSANVVGVAMRHVCGAYAPGASRDKGRDRAKPYPVPSLVVDSIDTSTPTLLAILKKRPVLLPSPIAGLTDALLMLDTE
jgi:hypothetical protein